MAVKPFSLPLLQASDLGSLLERLNNGWREALNGHLGFVLLSSRGVLKEVEFTTDNHFDVLVPFNGRDMPSYVLVFNVRASAIVNVAQVPAKPADKGPRFIASGPCKVHIWMVP